MLVSASTNGTWATDGAEGVRGEVQRRAHQQAAGRAAPRDQPPRRRPALADQVPCARHEVGERVDLVQHLAVVVPPAAQLTPAADVRDRVAEPPVQQGQPRDREARVDRDLVAAVAVEDERGAAVARRARPGRPARSAPGCRPARWPTAGAARSRPGRTRPRPAAAAPGGAAAGSAHRVCGVAVVHRVGRHQGAVAEPVGARGCTPGSRPARPGRPARGRRSRAGCRRPAAPAARSARPGAGK